MKIRNVYEPDGSVGAGADWVLAGEGTAHLFYADATSLLNTGTDWRIRVDVPADGTPPDGFEPGQHDDAGGVVGWAPLAALPDGTELPDPALLVPGVHLLLDGDHLLPVADAEVLVERGARNLKRLLARAVKQGAAGVIFRHPDGSVFKMKA